MEEKEVQGATVHKRRVRYSGTHPKRFEEKYKEQNPEKYADTIEKVIKKGSTPAGMHISICVKEILDFLDIKPGMQGLDATLGYGGHTTEMLKKLEGQGHMYGLDVDPIEIVKTKARLKERGFDGDILTVKQISTNWFRRPDFSILFWQISACHPCRSTIRREDLPTRRMVR